MKRLAPAVHLSWAAFGLHAVADPPAKTDPSPPQPKEAQLYPIRLRGKMGYIDRAGKVVIRPQFDNAWPMSEGYGNVMIGLKRGLIDRAGKVLIKPKYRYDGGLENVQEGLVRVMTDQGLYGFVNPRGEEVIPARFNYALGFSEGLAPAVADKKFGYIDRTGKFAIKLARAAGGGGNPGSPATAARDSDPPRV
jgi:hypothetical protein